MTAVAERRGHAGRLGFYSAERPHSSLGYATPAEFVAGLEQQRAGSTPPVASLALTTSVGPPIYPRAMITVLHPDDHEAWLRGSYDEAVALQRPYPAEQMTVRRQVFRTREGGGTGGKPDMKFDVEDETEPQLAALADWRQIAP